VALPVFDSALLDQLARVFAEAALEELLREAEAQESASAPLVEPSRSDIRTTNAAHPGKEKRGVLKELDGADNTAAIP
jgi:hypothetical protein